MLVSRGCLLLGFALIGMYDVKGHGFKTPNTPSHRFLLLAVPRGDGLLQHLHIVRAGRNAVPSNA
jgi:hypothetical protein